ncbi:MAG TPA: toll/interleukin-1 receptor domain-containing protein [Thermoanaerobaculia bacterium]
MAEEFTFDVLLCHSQKDKTAVLELAERLKSDGVKVWLDDWEIRAGDHVPSKIDKGVESSRVLLLCMSQHELDSKWTTYETWVHRFRDPTSEERRFIPIRLDNSDVKKSIEPFRHVDYRPGKRRAAYPALLAACLPPRTESLPMSETSLPLLEKFARPLHVTEDRYLQLLLSNFTIVRKEQGFELRVAFNDDTPAIWDQGGKRHLRQLMSETECNRQQKKLDAFFDGEQKEPEYLFRDEHFVFRYGSGGTLPIISFRGGALSGEYYSFFYRDVYPVGWNIANGGTDSRAELLDPQETIERELREEIIVADFVNERRYVFAADKHKPIDHPAHMVARRLWAKFFPHRKFDDFKAQDIRIRWIKGPDSLRVNNGLPLRGLFLNINGKDFGIEVDRVAKIRLPGNVTLFDGEIDGAHLVNAPVGLFEVGRFNRRLKKHGGGASFRPDHFFFSAALHRGGMIDRELENNFIPHIRKFREQNEIDYLRRCIDNDQQFGLCPVTERIVKRFCNMGA